MGDPRPSPDRILQLATGACGTGILASGFSDAPRSSVARPAELVISEFPAPVRGT